MKKKLGILVILLIICIVLIIWYYIVNIKKVNCKKRFPKFLCWNLPNGSTVKGFRPFQNNRRNGRHTPNAKVLFCPIACFFRHKIFIARIAKSGSARFVGKVFLRLALFHREVTSPDAECAFRNVLIHGGSASDKTVVSDN